MKALFKNLVWGVVYAVVFFALWGFLQSCGDDFAAAVAADAGDARELVDAGAEIVDVVDAQRIDAGAELVDVAGELAADAGDADAGPPPLICKSIDGIGMCSSTGPWPYPCCRAMPCECCNKPNCGEDQ